MRLLKKFKVLFILSIIGLIGYAIYDPNVVDYPPIQAKVIQANQKITALNLTPDKGMKAIGAVLGVAVSTAKQTPLKASLQEVPDEIVVEDVVNQLASEIKNLPEEQARKLAASYCQQLMEATDSGAIDN